MKRFYIVFGIQLTQTNKWDFLWANHIHKQIDKQEASFIKNMISDIPGFAIILSCGFNIIWNVNRERETNIIRSTIWFSSYREDKLHADITWTIWASPPRIWKGVTASCGLYTAKYNTMVRIIALPTQWKGEMLHCFI